MDGAIICAIEYATTCLLVQLSFELPLVLPTYSDLVGVLEVCSQLWFMEMMLSEVPQQILVDVYRRNDYAW